MRASWYDPLGGESVELILTTLTEEGEEATLGRVLSKLDEAPLSQRRDNLYLLAIIPSDAALAWLDARIESPVVEDWGITAALLGIRWERLATWMARGRPHSLAALDALVAYAHPHPGSSKLHQAVQPLLVAPPSLAELRSALASLLSNDDSPRVAKSAREILSRASEILRHGPPSGVSARAFFARVVAEQQAEQLLWSESRGDLPVPAGVSTTSPKLKAMLRQRWAAAVSACERLGGHGAVRIGPALTAKELAKIQRELDVVIPVSVAEVFTCVAGVIDVSWRLLDGCEAPAPFREVTSARCAWDARRLPELERLRRSWAEKAFRGSEDESGRVWRDKLPLFDTSDGDIIAVDLSHPKSAPVVYLSREGGKGHGRVLGYSMLDFVDRWTLIGCVGPDAWQIAPFLPLDRPYLDPVGEIARQWRAWFGLEVMTAV